MRGVITGRMRWLFVVALLLCSRLASGGRAPFSLPLEQQGFERVSERDGVTVYKHRTASEIRLAAEARLSAQPDDVMAALLDYPGQAGNIKRLSESRVLVYRAGRPAAQEQSRGEPSTGGWLLVYQRLNLPVIDDRDFNLQVTWGRDREVRWIEYRALPDHRELPAALGGARVPPPRRGVVRVTLHEGLWQLRPVDGGRATWVRFQVRMDMGGWVPRWMVRGSSAKELPSLFQSVRGMLSRTPQRRVAWFPR